MLGIGLGEHHQLDVGRVAPELREGVQQVVDLVVGQRQPQFAVRRLQRRLAAALKIDGSQGCGAT
jgi:hypothetical protein